MSFMIRSRDSSGSLAAGEPKSSMSGCECKPDRAQPSSKREAIPMEFELKKLSKAAIPAALERAERYRLLNEPAQAESICQDILAVEPDNREALVLLILALSDLFSENILDNLDQAWSLLPRLAD